MGHFGTAEDLGLNELIVLPRAHIVCLFLSVTVSVSSHGGCITAFFDDCL